MGLFQVRWLRVAFPHQPIDQLVRLCLNTGALPRPQVAVALSSAPRRWHGHHLDFERYREGFGCIFARPGRRWSGDIALDNSMIAQLRAKTIDFELHLLLFGNRDRNEVNLADAGGSDLGLVFRNVNSVF